MEMLGLSKLADRNPHDLSTGEREKVVVASTLLSPLPELVVMDEPTRGLDYRNKRAVTGLLREFGSSGGTVFVVTHDVEFAAALADRAAIIGYGSIITEGAAGDVLSDSLFFSPQANRLLGDRCGGVVREEDAVSILERMRNERTV
jgi:energy-coupling factor transport system ATP-binding protein